MPDYSLADKALSLFTSPERARTIAGDFAEDAERHGSFWFWRQVSGTAVSLALRQVASAPVRTAVLVLLGNRLLDAALFVFGSWVAAIVGQPDSEIWPELWVIWRGIAAFLTGLLLARLSAGREVAICGVVAISRQLLLFIAWIWLIPAEYPLTRAIVFSNLWPASVLFLASVLHRLIAQSRSRDSGHSEPRQSPNQ